MSYTIVIDEQQASRDLANVVNEIVRRCRIGKVTEKPISIDRFGIIKTWPAPSRNWWDDPFRPTWGDDPMFGGANRKCSCKPGQACGNAACPYMHVVTC